MNLKIFTATAYFAALIIYQIVGVWSISIDSKSTQNRLLSAMSLGLSVWSFGFIIMLYTDSVEDAVLMGRVAGFGVTALGAMFFHFVLVNVKSQIFKGKRWFLYLPPLFAYVIIYLISDDIVVEHMGGYTLRWLHSGFEQTFAEHLSNFYSLICFAGAALILYIHFRRDSHPKLHEKIKNMFFATAIGFALLFVTMFVRTFIFEFVPPAILLSTTIITASLVYNSYKYKFLSRKVPLRRNVENIQEAVGDQSIHIANVFLMYCNTMYLIIFFFGNGIEGWTRMIPSIASALVMYNIAFSGLPMRKKDLYLALIVVVNLFVGFAVSNDMNQMTVATFGFAMLIFAIISENVIVRTILVASVFIGMMITGQAVLGFEIELSRGDYFFRLIFAVMIFYAIEFIGRKIRHDEEKNYNHLKFQEILTSFSIKSVESHVDNMGELIDGIAAAIAKYFIIEESYILSREGDKYKSKGFSIPAEFVEDMAEGEYIYVNDVHRLSLRDEDQVHSLFGNKTASLLVIPIVRDGNVGAVYCGVSERKMKDVLNDIIKTISNTIKNIFEKYEKENIIFSYAYFDTSSGLPNRNMFTRKLESAIDAVQKGSTQSVAVVFIGFEQNKRISGVNTKEIPEQHLGVIGNRLAGPDCFVARFGNDNLIMLIENFDDLRDRVESIHAAFEAPVVAGDVSVNLSVVTGVAVYPDGGATARALVKNADLALYEARRSTGQRSVFYSAELESKLQERLSLMNSLYRALENEELLLMYQPQVDSKTEMIVGAEALIRWNHPEKGMISPGLFIPLAEETGVISHIGRWVLEEACVQAKKWQRAYGKEFLMAVNVSTKQLHDGTLAKTVENVLKKTGLAPESLEIEITESEEMTRGANQAIYNLHRLRELGVKIAIDDFGTKYSSLARLRHMPITKLKIDMGFVRAIESGEKHQNLVKSIISLGKNLGLTILAEGVETELQYKFLRDNGCDKIQGYYFFKPLRQEEIERILKMGAE